MARLFGKQLESLHINSVLAKSTDESVEMDIQRLSQYRQELSAIRKSVDTSTVMDEILGDDPLQNRLLSKNVFLKVRQVLAENQPVLEWSRNSGTSVFAGFINHSLKGADTKIKLLSNLTILKEDRNGKEILNPKKNMSAEFCEKIEILFSELEKAQNEYLKLNETIYKLQEKTLTHIINQEIDKRTDQEFRLEDHIKESSKSITNIKQLPPATEFKNLFKHPEFYANLGSIEISEKKDFVRLTIQSDETIFSSSWDKCQSTNKVFEIRNEKDFAPGYVVECTKDSINVSPMKQDELIDASSEEAAAILLKHVIGNAPKNFCSKLEETAKKVFCVKGEM